MRERKGQVAQPEYLLVKRVGDVTFMAPVAVPSEVLKQLKTYPDLSVTRTSQSK